MLPHSWRPSYTGPLERLGNANDGGYVVATAAVDGARTLISMGLNADWSFEADFLSRGGNRVVCFDHTVNATFWRNRTVKAVLRGRLITASRVLAYRRFFGQDGVDHRQQMVGYDVPGSLSLNSILTEGWEEPILLKVDIEGWEYRILDQIVAHQQKFSGVIIEFHDVDLHRDVIDRFLASMEGAAIVWLHANNFGGVDRDGDPTVIEVSLARHIAVSRELACGDADMITTPNDPGLPELTLNFADR